MIRNNKELKRSLFLLLGVCLLGILAGFLIAPQTGLLVLSVSVAVCLIFLFTEISRYQKLQSFSGQLNALLTHGTPLPIQDYEEGELSLLAKKLMRLITKTSMPAAKTNLIQLYPKNVFHSSFVLPKVFFACSYSSSR